ncbi:LacI family DNA-binding transcriptional regulator [Microbacterium sp. A94]|uniref:LacI family DNA-binding transcriptional regulator n=1 Tax=Microbacterium sp. A94 TaxID=3450717 RepID=UPI003F431CB3
MTSPVPRRNTGQSTIASVAAEAEVSVPTVSKVLNGRPGVSDATRARVEAVMRERDFRRSARGPAPARVPLVDLAFHELSSTWSIEIIRGVEAAAADAGASVVVSEFSGKRRPQQSWMDAVLARRPVGVILVLSALEEQQQHQLESRSIPFVVLDTAGELPPGVATVGSNNWNGGLVATRHLVELGHRRIAVISGPEDLLCSRARIDGFRSALGAAGLAVHADLIVHGTFEIEAGYEHARRMLVRQDRPTAIFAGSDLQAIGVLRAAAELGLAVPRDLSVVGYDNLPVTQWFSPALTTVNQPLKAMASAATTMLMQLARGEKPALSRIDLATDLVVRESTAPPLSGSI